MTERTDGTDGTHGTDRRAALRTAAALAAVAGAAAAGCTPKAASRPAAAREPTGTPATRGPAPGPRGFPGLPVQISHSPRGRPEIALTFHGQGDPGTARAVLAEAERAGARVTVLAVGSWLDAHPRLARRVLDGGHDLGNHTLNHRDINALPEAAAYAEITGCADRLRRLTGGIGNWFRPSRARRASPLVARLARRAGYPHVLSYDVDSLDFTSPGAPAVARTVAAGARPGSVVSLHFGYADTVAALPAVLDDLHRRGLRAVTTTELLT
nr:polysaccharide deacetylase family protein [Streptomyces aureocirculatus]